MPRGKAPGFIQRPEASECRGSSAAYDTTHGATTYVFEPMVDLSKREIVVHGIHGAVVEALLTEGLKGCDGTVHQYAGSLEPFFNEFSLQDVLLGRKLLGPQAQRTEVRRLEQHFSIAFGHQYKPDLELFKAVLVDLLSLQQRISFELICDNGQIHLQISASVTDGRLLESSWKKLAEVRLIPGADLLPETKYDVMTLTPSPPYFRAVTTLASISWLDSLLPALHESDGHFIVQILLQPAHFDWGGNIVRCLETEKRLQALNVRAGFKYSALSEEQYKLTSRKASSPLFFVVPRVAVPKGADVGPFAPFFNNIQYGGLPLKLMPVSEYDAGPSKAQTKCMVSERLTVRTGFPMSVGELATLVSLPSAPVVKFCKLYHQTTETRREDILLGHANRSPVFQPGSSRFRHTVVVGKTGKGKSSLLLHMIRQDIEQGRGVGILDPHGDLVRDVLDMVPNQRISDVVYFSPVDPDHVLGFNPFTAVRESDPGKMADDLVYCFRNIFTSWGERMEAIYRQIFFGLYTLPNSCLADIRLLLSREDPALRNRLLQLVNNEEARRFWQEDFYGYSRGAFDPILNKLGKFLLNENLARIFSQRHNLVDLDYILNSGQILLVHLPTGELSSDGVNVIGSILITSLFHAVLRRSLLPEDKRREFALYIDEFQRFSTKSTQDILREARKFKLALILAFQQFAQIRTDIRVALGNVDSVIALDLGLDDAQQLIKQFPGLDLADLQSKGVGEAWAIIGEHVHRFRSPAPRFLNRGNAEEIIAASRVRYCTPAQQETPVFSTQLPYDEI